jgi:SAM-dependent methyltransferase
MWKALRDRNEQWHGRTAAGIRLPQCATLFIRPTSIAWISGRQFDAVLLMFAVLSYQLDNAGVTAALRTARRHLRSGGLLLFDVWYGPAVLFQRPSERVKTIPTLTGKISRASSSELDTSRHVCTVRFHIWKFDAERLSSETVEEHTVRYFFPLELNLFLESTGFNPTRLGAFPDFERDPDEKSWNVLAVARAV